MSAALLRKRSRSRRHSFAAVSVAVALVSTTLVSAAGASPSGSNPYFLAPFSVRTNPFTFGQDPSWTPDGRVLSNEPRGPKG